MKSIRVSAIVTLLLLTAFHTLRAAAAQCTGNGCDAYIPVSLLVPLLVLLLAGVTGVMASVAGRGIWRGLLAGCTLLSVLGPIAALAAFRDSPDTFVLVATALVLFAPVSALAFTFLARP